MLSGSAKYSTEDSNASLVASLSLPVLEEPAEIRPYLFKSERLLTSSECEERLEVDGHSSKEEIGNTDWYIHKQCNRCNLKFCDARCKCDYCQTTVCCQEIDEMKALLVGDLVAACITQHPTFTNACLDTVVLTIAYHGH